MITIAEYDDLNCQHPKMIFLVCMDTDLQRIFGFHRTLY